MYRYLSAYKVLFFLLFMHVCPSKKVRNYWWGIDVTWYFMVFACVLSETCATMNWISVTFVLDLWPWQLKLMAGRRFVQLTTYWALTTGAVLGRQKTLSEQRNSEYGHRYPPVTVTCHHFGRGPYPWLHDMIRRE